MWWNVESRAWMPVHLQQAAKDKVVWYRNQSEHREQAQLSCPARTRRCAVCSMLRGGMQCGLRSINVKQWCCVCLQDVVELWLRDQTIPRLGGLCMFERLSRIVFVESLPLRGVWLGRDPHLVGIGGRGRVGGGPGHGGKVTAGIVVLVTRSVGLWYGYVDGIAGCCVDVGLWRRRGVVGRVVVVGGKVQRAR